MSNTRQMTATEIISYAEQLIQQNLPVGIKNEVLTTSIQQLAGLIASSAGDDDWVIDRPNSVYNDTDKIGIGTNANNSYQLQVFGNFSNFKVGTLDVVYQLVNDTIIVDFSIYESMALQVYESSNNNATMYVGDTGLSPSQLTSVIGLSQHYNNGIIQYDQYLSMRDGSFDIRSIQQGFYDVGTNYSSGAISHTIDVLSTGAYNNTTMNSVNNTREISSSLGYTGFDVLTPTSWNATINAGVTSGSHFITTDTSIAGTEVGMYLSDAVFKLVGDNGSGNIGVYTNSLTQYANDAAAGLAGLTTGMLFVNSLGYICVKS